jgi:XTP/dITP diphosphohydrolase
VIVIATGNKGKFGEIAHYLSGIGEGLLSLADLDASFAVAEDRPTYLENAWKKARKIGNRFGMKTLADDSGLEVEALNGAPGVHSARYGATDAERMERLLRALKGVEQKDRGAVFKAYLVYYLPEVEQTFIFYGSVRGYIGFEKRGGLGFGFDPVFMLPAIEKSLSELGMEEKNRVSHRGQALAAFRAFLGI